MATLHRIKRKLLLFLLLPLVLVVGSYLILYYLFHNGIDRALKKEKQEWLVQEFKNTEPLPEKFYQTMEKYEPDFFEWNTWDYKLMSLVQHIPTSCPCNDLYLPIILGARGVPGQWIPFNQKDLVIKLFIEKHFSQRDCFTYRMRNTWYASDSLDNSIKGVASAAHYFFQKSLEELSEKEIIGLYVISYAPTRYNLFTNRENYEARVNAILKR